MKYYLRTDNGTLVGKMTARLAGMMMDTLRGEWKEKKFVSGENKNVFVFSEDSSYGNDIMQFSVWKGFYLEVNK
jgi:hypothetical protein